MKSLFLVFTILVLLLISTLNLSYANQICSPENKKVFKLEAWLSKKHEKVYRDIRNEFAEMGNTNVGLFFYPGKNPSRIVAIGRCVPVHLAQHFLRKASKFSLGTTHLVNQGFISSHWSGLGTSIFSENSMNPVNSKQLALLMDENLDTESFHALYKTLTVQSKTATGFGLILANPKLLQNNE